MWISKEKYDALNYKIDNLQVLSMLIFDVADKLGLEIKYVEKTPGRYIVVKAAKKK